MFWSHGQIEVIIRQLSNVIKTNNLKQLELLFHMNTTRSLYVLPLVLDSKLTKHQWVPGPNYTEKVEFTANLSSSTAQFDVQ